MLKYIFSLLFIQNAFCVHSQSNWFIQAGMQDWKVSHYNLPVSLEDSVFIDQSIGFKPSVIVSAGYGFRISDKIILNTQLEFLKRKMSTEMPTTPAVDEFLIIRPNDFLIGLPLSVQIPIIESLYFSSGIRPEMIVFRDQKIEVNSSVTSQRLIELGYELEPFFRRINWTFTLAGTVEWHRFLASVRYARSLFSTAKPILHQQSRSKVKYRANILSLQLGYRLFND